MAFSSVFLGKLRLAWIPRSHSRQVCDKTDSGNSNLFPGMYRVGHADHDHQLGYMGNLTDRSGPGPSILIGTLPKGAKRTKGRWPEQTSDQEPNAGPLSPPFDIHELSMALFSWEQLPHIENSLLNTDLIHG